MITININHNIKVDTWGEGDAEAADTMERERKKREGDGIQIAMYIEATMLSASMRVVLNTDCSFNLTLSGFPNPNNCRRNVVGPSDGPSVGVIDQFTRRRSGCSRGVEGREEEDDEDEKERRGEERENRRE